ncbi:GlsB/YeaQ/YmgE family stress response membrane protein [Sulfitobacter profundi]|uniref:GlsB/YeaQ/YmgE family stress response membrane protein n=1 Tax=Sulfitobacter profundi TaxID=2679961 RepID=A0ABW1YZI6_9RHOB
MEAFLDTLGAVALIALVVVGLAAGAIAGAVAGRHRILYLILGVVGAVALPFILAALGVTVVAAGACFCCWSWRRLARRWCWP